MKGCITGEAEQVQQTWRLPDQCFDLDSITNPLLAGEKPMYRLYRSMPNPVSEDSVTPGFSNPRI